MNKDKFLKVKDWKEKNQVQFIPQYCPDTFLKRAKRIKDGEIFRVGDSILFPGIKQSQIIVDFHENRRDVFFGTLFDNKIISAPINEIVFSLRPSDKTIVEHAEELLEIALAHKKE